MVQFDKIKARDIMHTDVVRFSPSTPIEEAIEKMDDMHISGAPVLDTKAESPLGRAIIDLARAIDADAVGIEQPGRARTRR